MRIWPILFLALGGCASAAKFPPPPAFHQQQSLLKLPEYDVAYTRTGKGPTVLLLHGGGTWSYSWRRNIDDLARSHDVISVDMIGHGYTVRTARSAPAYDLTETTRFIGEVLDGLHVQHASIIGNSWGGGWALAFAQAHPERVDALVLIGSSGLPGKDRLEWEALTWPIIGEVMGGLVRRSDIKSGLKAAVYDPTTVTQADVDAVWGPFRRDEVRASQVGFMRNLNWARTEKGLPSTRVPTLVLWGEKDRYVTRASQERLARLIPGSQFQILPKAGHVAHEDQPAFVDTIAAKFIDQAESRRLPQ